jgi:hypothetical protein
MSNEYRLYQLVDNHIVGVENFEAAEDGEALRYASMKIMGQAVEIWCGNRRVGLIHGSAAEAERSSAQSA